MFVGNKKEPIFAHACKSRNGALASRYYNRRQAIAPHGALAQLVEQWTENPCVPGSIPGGTTEKTFVIHLMRVFLFWWWLILPFCVLWYWL